MFKLTFALLNPDLSFFGITGDPYQLASDSHLIRIHTVFTLLVIGMLQVHRIKIDECSI